MKQRVISAAVALAIVIPLLILRGIPFAIGVGIVSILALKEILDLKTSHQALPNIIKFIATLCVLTLVYVTYDAHSIIFGISYEAVAFTLLALLLPTIFYAKTNRYTTQDAIYMIGATLFVGVFFNTLILIVNKNIWEFIYLFLITSFTDMFAYFIGKLIGKHKNVPDISPNKTWEGSIGGTIVATIVSTIFYMNMIGPHTNILKVVFVTLVLSVIGQLGDLLFSKIKRENGIKDFSNIMPGHGGILDRLDSLSFVVLAYILLLRLI